MRKRWMIATALIAMLVTATFVVAQSPTQEWLGNFLFRVSNPTLAWTGKLTMQNKAGTSNYLTVGTQTAPTCDANVATHTGDCVVTGTDSFMHVVLNSGIRSPAAGGAKDTLTFTFNTAYASAPACIAAWEGPNTYGYYVQTVATTTTTVAVSVGAEGSPTKAPSFGVGDKLSIICGGVS